jgi:hypothetical protein
MNLRRRVFSRFYLLAVSSALIVLGCAGQGEAQTVTANAAQQLVFAGLRSIGAKGQINAVATDAAGDIYVAFDQGDGIRILKVANDGAALLAQTQLGAAGDSAVALALDGSGNVYVAGVSSSGSLMATSGAAISSATVGTTSSFVAKFDGNLDETFLTFTGGTRIAASAVAESGDSVFVTGITYGSDLPVTSNGIQQAPALGSFQNGFVEAFSADGATLVYATYITGAQGDTTPTAIAADAGDDVWLVGSTTASGFPTIAAVVPIMLSTPSGFLLQLTPAGDGIVYSTFVPGTGLSAVALDSTGLNLWVAGQVALGQFPVDTVESPLVPTAYQVLLRMSLDGSEVESGTVIAPGLQSVVAAASGGAAWVGGSFTPGLAPLLPQSALSRIGNAYAVRVTPGVGVDQTVRFGGLANASQAYASLPITLNGLAVDSAGDLIAGGIAQPTASSNLLETETYDLPLRSGPTAALPSAVTDAELTSATCAGSLCSGSAGYLAEVGTTNATAALTFSTGALPFVTLRNLGSAAAQNLQLATSAGTLASNCGSTLGAGSECDLLLSGGGAGTLTASASGTESIATAFGYYSPTAPASTIVFWPKELDFGVQTSASPAATQTVTVTNLGTASQTFGEGIASMQSTSPFSESTSDCALGNSGATKILAAGATCHITVGFSASSTTTSDGFVTGEWIIAADQLYLTGYSQAAALNVSASEVDFGTEFQGGLLLPRYLYLSNASASLITHAAVSSPAGSPFTVTDGCPASIAPGAVCRLRLDYLSNTAPSSDSVTLALDMGLSVLVTGTTQPAQTVGGSTVTATISVSPDTAIFGDAVPVTGVSSVTQTISVTNPGPSAVPLSLAVAGDFTYQTSCTAVLAAQATCAVALQFAPSQPGPRQGLLTVSTGAGIAPISVALSGTALGILASNNGTLPFIATPIGQPFEQFYKVTRPFDSLSVAATGPYLVTLIEDDGYGYGEPPSSDYVTSGTGTCHNCWVGVRFLPTTAGAQNGTLTFTSSSSGLPYQLTLSGSGIATLGLVVSPSVLNFGAVPAGSTSGEMLVTLTNLLAAGSAVTITAVTTTGDFEVVSGSNACSGPLGTTVSCSVQVAFTPAESGTSRGTLVLMTSAGAVSVALTGTSVPGSGISISPLALSLGNGGGLANSATVWITNSGTSSAQIATPTTGTANFVVSTGCGALSGGATCEIQVSFVAGTTPVTDTLSIPVTTNGSSGTSQTKTYAIALSGVSTIASAGLIVSPATMSFGPVATGTQGWMRQVTVTNQTAKQLAISLDLPQNYALSGPGCGTLASGGSCDVEIQFVPLTNGDSPGTITVLGVPSDGSPASASLAYVDGFGVGTGALSIRGGLIINGIFNFGTVAVGQSSSQTFLLSNDGLTSSLPITVRRITSAPPFLSTSTCGTALAVGDSCAVNVTYAPQGTYSSGSGASGVDAGILAIESDAQSSPDVVNLTGQPGLVGSTGSPTLATFSLSNSSLSFATTPVGDTSPLQTIVLTNTGTASIEVASVTASKDFFIKNGCSLVPVGSTCSISIASTPQGAGVHLGALEISSTGATSLEFVTLVSIGTAPALIFSPTTLNFGSVQLGANSTLGLVVTNTSSGPVVFTSISGLGDYSSSGTCPSSGGVLTAQTSCAVSVTFAPTAVGLRSGTLEVATSASTSPLQVSLSGTGTQSSLVVTPSNLSFGSLLMGAASTMTLTLSNQGTAPVTKIALSIPGDYLVTTPCGQTTLSPGANCSVTVTFTPAAVGTRPGALVVVSSDPSSPLSVPLSGTGIANSTFTLTVNGASNASGSVESGRYITFQLVVTPVGSFGGNVALTCTPVQPVANGSCSLLPPQVNLAGGAQSATVTVNTEESGSGVGGLMRPARGHPDRTFLALLLLGMLLIFRRGRSLRRWLGQGVGLTAILVAILLAGCGSRGSSIQNDTPAGTYQFTVTASSTSGAVTYRTVTLSVVVSPN